MVFGYYSRFFPFFVLVYTLGNLEVEACPDGFTTISDKATCELASVNLGLDYSPSDNDETTTAICNWSNIWSISRVSSNNVESKWICKNIGKK